MCLYYLGEMRWSTEYGNGDANAANAMTANSEKVWMVGFSNNDWTFEDFVDGDEGPDYFRVYDPGFSGDQEATIARFDIPLILEVEPTVEQSEVGLLVYPNPASSSIVVSLENINWSGQNQIKLFDAVGQLISEQKFTYKKLVELNLETLAAGTYYVQLVSNNSTYSVAIVKQ